MHGTILMKNVNKISLRLVHLSIFQSVMTHRMDHTTIYKYQVSELHEFVSPFTLYWNLKKAENSVRKRFEKTSIIVNDVLHYDIVQEKCQN